MTPSTSLILGGARSGKSRYAEQLASASGKEVIYVATARAGDVEMAVRIVKHRQQRPVNWTTVEEPLALGAVIAQWSAPERVVLIDCITLWLSNLLFNGGVEHPEVGQIEAPPRFASERRNLLQALGNVNGDVILVSNEVGSGIVPAGAVSRWFVDEAGWLNQDLAASCGKVTLVVAGLPMHLKG